MKKQRIVVVCPGRGSYTKDTLGYLNQNAAHVSGFLSEMNELRRAIGEPTLTDLDSAPSFNPGIHTKGEHASILIHACSYADFHAIDRQQFEIVAVTGNSMGWYITLALSGALNEVAAFQVINGMGSMMKQEIIGGQVIYPIVDENWRLSPTREQEVLQIAANLQNSTPGAEIYLSIRLGGFLVFGGNRVGTAALLKGLPRIEDYPFQLINHAAFHTPLLKETSERAFAMLPQELFQTPQLPMIDGRGHIWQPYATDLNDLYQYTFGHQVLAPYDFTSAVTVALKEFCPDRLVLLGPGSSLGGSIGQILVANDWLGINSKSSFAERQVADPFLIAMGRSDQRARLLANQ